jgi:hypothetical protein
MPCRRRAALAAAAFATLAGCDDAFELDPPAPEVVARDAGDVVDAGEVVVLVADDAAADRLQARAAQRGYVAARRDPLPGLDMVLTVFEMPSVRSGPEAIAELEGLERGATAGLNHAYRPEPARPGADARLYADALLNWPEEGCVAQAPVGVIDTALAPVAGLGGARVAQADFTAGTGGDTGHGTAVAELIAGPGRLSGAVLFHAAVVGPVDGAAPAAGVDAMVRALDWLQGSGVRLVNVSLAGPYNKILDRSLQAADARGMVVVAAAGNAGREGPPRYPAAFAQTIAVTAVDASLAPYAAAPAGEHIDIAAPGVDVFVPGAGRYLTGTSIAAPFVTAAIAADPEAARAGSAAAVRARLAATSRDLGQPGPDRIFGAGLVQAAAPCRAAG